MQIQRTGSQETIVLGQGSGSFWGMCIAVCYIPLSSTGAGGPTEVEDGNFKLNINMWTSDQLESAG